MVKIGIFYIAYCVVNALLLIHGLFFFVIGFTNPDIFPEPWTNLPGIGEFDRLDYPVVRLFTYGLVPGLVAITFTLSHIVSIVLLVLSTVFCLLYAFVSSKFARRHIIRETKKILHRHINYNLNNTIHDIQNTFDCCGVTSVDDWLNYKWKKIPHSCCGKMSLFDTCTVKEVGDRIGCLTYAEEELDSHILSENIRALVTALECILLIVFAVLMILEIRKKENAPTEVADRPQVPRVKPTPPT